MFEEKALGERAWAKSNRLIGLQFLAIY